MYYVPRDHLIFFLIFPNFTGLAFLRGGADVAKWIKAVDCESTMRGFNSRRSPITPFHVCYYKYFVFKFFSL